MTIFTFLLAQLTEPPGFDEGRPYAMEGVNRKNFVTTQYAKLAIGKSTRTVPFIACSTAKFTEVCNASR